jgi:hypothetical protein
MTYMFNNVQYVAVACGGNFQIGSKAGDDLYVFALRDRTQGQIQQYEAPGFPRGTATRFGESQQQRSTGAPAGGDTAARKQGDTAARKQGG